KIDQDSYLSGQLALWDQRGSNVIRGNVLAIPVENTILYVEPIYLQAETAAYPELRLVVIMHGDKMSYAPSFEQALRGLLGEDRSAGVVVADTQDTSVQILPEIATSQIDQLVREANQAFEDYLRHTGSKNFEQASRSLNTLENAL